MEKPKICPFMSKLLGNNDTAAEIKCRESECALWVTMSTTPEAHQIQGCAFALNAQKNSEGKTIFR